MTSVGRMRWIRWATIPLTMRMENGNSEVVVRLEYWYEKDENGDRVTGICRKHKKKIRTRLSKYDATTGRLGSGRKRHVDFEGCYRRVIPLEDFYISNIYQSNVQLQPDVIWKQILKKQEFKSEFGRYKNIEKVKEGLYNAVVEEIPPSTTRNIFPISEGCSRGLRWYSRWKDRLVVVANAL